MFHGDDSPSKEIQSILLKKEVTSASLFISKDIVEINPKVTHDVF